VSLRNSAKPNESPGGAEWAYITPDQASPAQRAAWAALWDWLLDDGYHPDVPDIASHPALSCQECSQPVLGCLCKKEG
jgi:hypothetical protein